MAYQEPGGLMSASVNGPAPATDPSAYANVGPLLSIGGALMSSIGAFYAAKSQQTQFKSQALSLEFEQSMAALNALQAEQDAQATLRAGQQEIGQLGLRSAQERGSVRASQGASGVQAGVGNAAEVQASMRLAQEMDALTINANAIRAAGARRTQATNARNEGLLAGVSARNLRGSARSINPYMAANASLLSNAGTVASQWISDRRQTAYRSR